MADASQRHEEIVLQILTRSTPIAFWKGFLSRARSAYADAYSSVQADRQLNVTQRMSKLWQERHFKMEWLLIDEATAHAMEASDRLITKNNCAYAFAGSGAVNMTQKYVRTPGSMPSPAKFRKQLAAGSDFHRDHGLMFGDEPKGLFQAKQVNGVILHSPIGSGFSEQTQNLGSIGFYVPYKDFSGWAAELNFVQIMSAYSEDVRREDKVMPKVRRAPDPKEGSNG